METADSEPFCTEGIDYIQHSADLLTTRNAEKLTGIRDAEPITTPQQVDIVIDWEAVRREAHNVMDTRFFQDLMIRVAALRKMRAEMDPNL